MLIKLTSLVSTITWIRICSLSTALQPIWSRSRKRTKILFKQLKEMSFWNKTRMGITSCTWSCQLTELISSTEPILEETPSLIQRISTRATSLMTLKTTSWPGKMGRCWSRWAVKCLKWTVCFTEISPHRKTHLSLLTEAESFVISPCLCDKQSNFA